MLVGAVAGVDHAGADPAGVGEPVRGTAGAVPDHHRVGTHRLQGEPGALEARALAQVRALGGEVDDVRAEPLGGRLERDPGARRVLEEQVDHGAAAQRGQLLDRPVGQRPHLLGGAEDELRVVPRQVAGAEQVSLHSWVSSIVTSSAPSISATRSRTSSTREVGRFLPTKSARIGRSRWPRSTSTTRRTALGRPTSLSASSADLIVRPLNSTSSTRTTTLPSTPPGGISVGISARAGLSRRSSRYIVTSSEPTGTSYPSTAATRSAIRRASGTPRLGIPSRTRSRAPLLRSRISWEMRVSARAMSRSSRTTRPEGGAACCSGVGWAHTGALDLLLRLTGRLV